MNMKMITFDSARLEAIGVESVSAPVMGGFQWQLAIEYVVAMHDAFT